MSQEFVLYFAYDVSEEAYGTEGINKEVNKMLNNELKHYKLFSRFTNTNVKAIDVDEKNIEYLTKQYTGPAKFDFIHGDVLSTPLNFLEKDNHRIVGNLPYNISTQIIIRLLELSDHIKDMHFLVQKEVAEKICGTSSSKNWGKLSIKIGLFFNSQKLFDVPPESFDIKPKVDSSFIRLTPAIDDFIMPKNKKDLFNLKCFISSCFPVIELKFTTLSKESFA